MDQNLTPYADAISAYSHRGYAKFATPGFQVASSAEQSTAQPELVELFGRALLAGDVQPLIEGIDHGHVRDQFDGNGKFA